jgi:DNA-binding transcriptional ArsR family regulator
VRRNNPLEKGSVDRRVRILKALANPTRLNIVLSLSKGAATVTDLTEFLELRQSIVSQQLGILRSSGIVQGFREGSFVRYELADRGVERLIGLLDQ